LPPMTWELIMPKLQRSTRRGAPAGRIGGERRPTGRRRVRALRAARAFAAALLVSAAPALGALPKVASINLCTDQLVLRLADPSQIVTVSWLSADPEESMLAHEAVRYPLNYGTAEELLRYDPDIVVAGSFTSTYTRALLRHLGYTVIDVAPELDVDDIERNLRHVAEAIGRADRGEALIAEMRERVRRLERTRPAAPVPAVVVRPGGFTVDAGSLAHALMTLAGLRNLPAEHGLDRWGSLSVETLLRTHAELLIVTPYRTDEPSLANAVLAHPALRAVAAGKTAIEIPVAYFGCGLPDSLDAVDMMRQAAERLRAASGDAR